MTEIPSGSNPVLLLWDIDHTLIENNGVNKEVYAAAFQICTGRKAAYPAVTEGRTDQDIMLNMLSANGIHGEIQPSRIIESLEAAMQESVAALADRGYILPGARESLVEAQGMAGVYQSVLSGNIRPNAVAKLATFDLDSFMDFDIGGYGSDDRLRPNLVRIAQERASAKLRFRFSKSNTILIGDTPRDVEAGRLGGAYVIGIASGSDSVERLRQEGADTVFQDLSDTGELASVIRGYQRS